MTSANPGGGMNADLWMVEAIVQPFKLDVVARALETVVGFSGMTVTESRGFGTMKLRADRQEAGSQSLSLGDSAVNDFERSVRIEVVVVGQHVAEAVADVITRAAHTGRVGDGRVFAWPIARAIRIDTGLEGADAV